MSPARQRTQHGQSIWDGNGLGKAIGSVKRENTCEREGGSSDLQRERTSEREEREKEKEREHMKKEKKQFQGMFVCG